MQRVREGLSGGKRRQKKKTPNDHRIAKRKEEPCDPITSGMEERCGHPHRLRPLDRLGSSPHTILCVHIDPHVDGTVGTALAMQSNSHKQRISVVQERTHGAMGMVCTTT